VALQAWRFHRLNWRVPVDISWAEPARLEAREGALGKPDQSINIVRLRRQDAMAPFSIVFFERSLKTNRRLIRDETVAMTACCASRRRTAADLLTAASSPAKQSCTFSNSPEY
jgi:hypothetical protein